MPEFGEEFGSVRLFDSQARTLSVYYAYLNRRSHREFCTDTTNPALKVPLKHPIRFSFGRPVTGDRRVGRAGTVL